MLAGTGSAAVSAIVFEAVRREGALRFAARARWLSLVLRLPLRVLVDTAIVFRGLARGRTFADDLRAIRFESGAAADARSIARRALAVWLVSAAPNTIAVEVDLENDVLLVHQLEPRAGPLLGSELAERSP
jgi:hypothetical protein